MATEEYMMKQMMGFSGFGTIKAKVENNLFTTKLNEAKRPAVKSIDKTTDKDDDDDDDVIGPLPPPSQSPTDKNITEPSKSTKKHVEEVDSDEDISGSESEDEDSPLLKIPQSHEINLNHGNKAIAALALDPSGSRLATGGMDFELKFWDFNSMDVNLKAFRTLQPVEGHWISTLQYSITGDKLLIAAGNAQPQVIDRDGHQLYECKKGDQYIVDMKNTKGHVSMVHCACWDPKNRDHFASCGDDGTIRLWDINTVKKNKDVIKLKNKQNRKTPCTYCCFDRNGKLIFGAGQDGSIQAWDTRRMFVNTAFKNMQAHSNGSDTSCLCIAADGNTFISRGGDDTLKLWDIRNFKNYINCKNDLLTFYSSTKCVFSPDERLILTGTSVKKGQGVGKLVFIERDTFETVMEVPFENTSVVSTLWHPKLNQVFIGLSDGNVKVLFDPDKSKNGATMCVGKVKKKRIDPGENMSQPQIINPHALRMYRERPRTDSMKKVKAKLRADPIASHKPDAPLVGHGVGGRLKEGMSLTGFVIRNIAVSKKDDLNPREAILKHAEEANKNPFWIAPAYSASQPKPIFRTASDSESEEEDDGILPRKKTKKE